MHLSAGYAECAPGGKYNAGHLISARYIVEPYEQDKQKEAGETI